MHIHSATIRGASHLRRNRPNQDAILLQQSDDGAANVIAIADGHGSSAQADRGARIAVEIASFRLLDLYASQRHLPNPLERCANLVMTAVGHQISTAWKRCIEAVAGLEPGASQLRPELLDRFGTTLLAALVTEEGAVYLQVGDGDAFYASGTEAIGVPSRHLESTIGDTTASLCLPRPELHLEVTVLRRAPSEAATLVLATDGWSKSYQVDNGPESFTSGVHTMMVEGASDQVGQKLTGWLEHMTREGSGDDITMAIVHWPRPEHGAAITPDEPLRAIASAGLIPAPIDAVPTDAAADRVVAPLPETFPAPPPPVGGSGEEPLGDAPPTSCFCRPQP